MIWLLMGVIVVQIVIVFVLIRRVEYAEALCARWAAIYWKYRDEHGEKNRDEHGDQKRGLLDCPELASIETADIGKACD